MASAELIRNVAAYGNEEEQNLKLNIYTLDQRRRNQTQWVLIILLCKTSAEYREGHVGLAVGLYEEGHVKPQGSCFQKVPSTSIPRTIHRSVHTK